MLQPTSVPQLQRYADAFPGALVARLPQIEALEAEYGHVYPIHNERGQVQEWVDYFQHHGHLASCDEAIWLNPMFEFKDDGVCKIDPTRPEEALCPCQGDWYRQDWRPGREMSDSLTLSWAVSTLHQFEEHAHRMGAQGELVRTPVPTAPSVRGYSPTVVILDEAIEHVIPADILSAGLLYGEVELTHYQRHFLNAVNTGRDRSGTDSSGQER